ncbi:MAG: hypothetical protein GF329_06150 [Candidatus Lokiarchaeota archaeon]|nr:hypothetical protein [Candidatus Lokiarchaeota archaeon]
MITKKITILIFIWCILLFYINLEFNFSDSIDIALFWISTLLLFGIVVYQIFCVENNTFVVFEIVIIYFLLHIVYQFGYFGLRGSDSYIDYNFLKSILNNGHFTFGKDDMAGWPMIHIYSGTVTLLTNTSSLLVAKYLPSIITSIIVFPIYLLIRQIYTNRKVALLSCLIFGSIPQFVSFEGLFIRETFAIFFFIFFFYILYTSKIKNIRRFRFLSIILIPIVIFAHHFTSFMIIIFLTIFLLISKIIPLVYRKTKNISFTTVHINTLFLMIVVGVLTYWLFLAVFILQDFFSIFYEATGVKELATYAERASLSTTIVTFKGNIIYYGFFFFNGILSLILFIKFIFYKNKQKIEDTSFTIFLYFSLFYGALALYVLGSILFPDRFLPFGWMFGLIPICGLLFTTKSNILKKFLIVIFILFLTYNIYNIDEDYYTSNLHRQGTVAKEKDYLIAEKIDFPDQYYGYIGLFGAIYDIQNIEFILGGGRNPIYIENLHNSSTLVVVNENLYIDELPNIKVKTPMYYEKIIELFSYQENQGIRKICDLGEIYILKGGM